MFVAAAKLPVLAKALPRVLGCVKTVVFWGPVDATTQQALEVPGRHGWGAPSAGERMCQHAHMEG